METATGEAVLSEACAPTTAPRLALSPAFKDFVAGAGSGIAGVMAGQPLDTIRVRLQQKGSMYTGALQCWRSLVAREGFKSLFRGMAYPLTTVALQNAVTFQAYGSTMRFLEEGQSEVPSSTHIFVAGMAAGTVQCAIQVPVDVLKIRLQLQHVLPGHAGYVGPLQLLSRVLKTGGLAGLYRGTPITLIRDVPSYGVYFALYEGCRDVLHPGRSHVGAVDNPVDMFLAGGIAGVVSWLLVYPFDVVKSRIQANCRQHSPYTGWLQCARSSLQEEGTGVFVKGLGASLGRAFVVNAAIFSAYELFIKLLP